MSYLLFFPFSAFCCGTSLVRYFLAFSSSSFQSHWLQKHKMLIEQFEAMKTKGIKSDWFDKLIEFYNSCYFDELQ